MRFNRTHLHPSLGQIQSHRELFPGEHIWILGVPERLLEFVQLVRGERGTGSSNFAWPIRFSQIQTVRLAQVQRIVKRVVHLMVAQVTEFRVSAITDRVGRCRVIWEQQRSLVNSSESIRVFFFLPSSLNLPWFYYRLRSFTNQRSIVRGLERRQSRRDTKWHGVNDVPPTDVSMYRRTNVGLKTGTERMVLKGCGRSIEARIEYAYQTIAWTFDTWTKERIGAIKLNRPRCQTEIDVPLI